MKKVLALLLVGAILLSGCASKKGGGDDDDGTSGTSTSTSTRTASGSSTGTQSTSGSSTAGPVGDGTTTVSFTRSTPDGAVPLGINFTLDATFADGAGEPVTPSSVTWAIEILAGNATNQTSTPGPTGTSLPANFTLNFTAAGNYTVVALVEGFGFVPTNATILVAAFPGTAGVPVFLDGAEGDTSQWVITSNIYINANLPNAPGAPATPDTFESTQAHPDGGWRQVTSAQHTGAKSWGTTYPDNYRSRMTSVDIPVPAGGATLSYWIKGGAEDNGVDGIFVLTGTGSTFTQAAYHTGTFADWTEFTLPLAGGPIKVQFRFDSDISCSNEGPAEGGDDLCGAGWDGGGLFLDDIKVA